MAPVQTLQRAVISTVTNIVTYSLWTLANKWQFLPVDKGGLGMDTPFLATAVQMLIAGVVSFVFIFGFGIQRRPGVTPRSLLSVDVVRRRILPLGFARGIDIGCGNYALSLVSVALQQIVKSTLPVFVSLLSVFFLNRSVPSSVWASLVPIVFGTAIAAYGNIRFQAVGLLLALVSCFGRAFKAVLNSRLLHADAADAMQPLEILLLEAPTTGLLLLVGPVLFIEAPRLFHHSVAATVDPTAVAVVGTSFIKVAAVNVVCGVLMFFNQASYITIIEQTSALTCQVLMNVKMLLLILVAVRVFGTDLSILNYVGIAVATIGCFLYGWASSLPRRVVARKGDTETV